MFGLIEWADIKSLDATKRWLMIEVTDPTKYLDRLTGCSRFLATTCRSLGSTTITIRFAGLTHSATEVVRICRSYGISFPPA